MRITKLFSYCIVQVIVNKLMYFLIYFLSLWVHSEIGIVTIQNEHENTVFDTNLRIVIVYGFAAFNQQKPLKCKKHPI
jgi:hypothetical protein